MCKNADVRARLNIDDGLSIEQLNSAIEELATDETIENERTLYILNSVSCSMLYFFKFAFSMFWDKLYRKTLAFVMKITKPRTTKSKAFLKSKIHKFKQG